MRLIIFALLVSFWPVVALADDKSPGGFFERDYAGVARGERASSVHDAESDENHDSFARGEESAQWKAPEIASQKSRKPFSSQPTQQTRDRDSELGNLYPDSQSEGRFRP